MSVLRPFRNKRNIAGFLAMLALAHALAGPARADAALINAAYALLEVELDAKLDFETLPRRAEPGIRLDAPMREGLVWLGERLAGQQVTGEPHDILQGPPTAPVAIAAGLPGAALSVAHHRGFGSNALFPLGPAGFPALAARGEGSVALLFDQGQRAIGLRIHSDYAAPLGAAQPQGTLTLAFYRRDGALIGQVRRRLETGITELGFRRGDGMADIAAITVTNDDPGGIALDDILYQTAPMAF